MLRLVGAVRLQIQRLLHDTEIVHFASETALVSSWFHRVSVRGPAGDWVCTLPRDRWERLVGRSRLARRGLRLDKCNVVPVADDLSALVLVRQGTVFHCRAGEEPRPVLQLRNCRNVLHQSIARTAGGRIVLGEYGANPSRGSVPVYASDDGGLSWQTVFEFPAGKIKHVHGCYWDPYRERVWVLTGDFAGECWMVSADEKFEQVEWHGDGTQRWRACNLFFEEDRITWLMDSQLEPSHVVCLDRRSGRLDVGEQLAGPVWYCKRLEDGVLLAATACEKGPGVTDEYAHVYASLGGETWREVYRLRHDRLPKGYFKFGVVGFADGPQTSDRFFLFGEALSGLDGRAAECRLDA